MPKNLNLYKNKILQKKADILSGEKKLTDLLDFNSFFGDNRNSIQKLKSKISDIARTNIFSFNINKFPTSIQESEIIKSGLESTELLIKNVKIPGKNIKVSTMNYSGIQRRYPGSYDLDPIEVTFYLDKSYNIYKLFNIWISEISGRSNSGIVGMNYLENIIAEGRISIFDLKKKEIYYCVLNELFPISISDLNYDVTNEDIQTFTVKFSYLDAIQPETNNYHAKEISGIIEGLFDRIGINNSSLSQITNVIDNINNRF